jgi:hypothetical protein
MVVFIEPVKGIREIADRVVLNVINYALNQPTQNLYFCLQSQFNRMIEEGNLIIPESIVSQWGVDDSIIIDWALDTLGLTEREVELTPEEEAQVGTL